MQILLLNGPNLNLLGQRETSIYGNQDFDSFFKELKAQFPTLQLDYFQSNVEGEIINKLQEAGGTMAIDNLSIKTQMSLGSLAGQLLMMEMKGIIKALPGKQFKVIG